MGLSSVQQHCRFRQKLLVVRCETVLAAASLIEASGGMARCAGQKPTLWAASLPRPAGALS
jgi:hypothetical protein